MGIVINILDLNPIHRGDNIAPIVVKAGHLFLLGDNRDRSLDSRFPAAVEGAIGLVPINNVIGKAFITFFSTDGSANLNPITWITATPLVTHRRGILMRPITHLITILRDHHALNLANTSLIEEALTHGSFGQPDYQRLEFLGDRILGLVIAEELFPQFPAGFGREVDQNA